MSKFVGRTEELASLKALVDKSSSSLVVLKGRRRIGKSRLAEEFAKVFNYSYIFTGLPPSDKTTAKTEREDFCQQLDRVAGVRGINADDWGDLFWHLAKAAEKGSVLIVLDEINWMGAKDPSFLGKLKSAWDLYFKKNPNLVMILSGSMSAWIERNILSHTGFMGRISLELSLDELPLGLCDKFWGRAATQISAYEKFKLLSVIGGVPRYLEEINPKMTAEENILRLAFHREGILYHEFDRIFSDLFAKRSKMYQTIVEVLAYGVADLNHICEATGYQKSGVISEYLEDLLETGYIARDYTWSIKTGKESRLSHFRLCDNYLRFYLRYIQPNKNKIEKGRIIMPPAWYAIMGLQFENLVINNFRSLDKLLAIAPDEIVYDNPFFQRPTKESRGCQIDYMLQTRFNTLYVCEIKFSKDKIAHSVIEQVQDKINRLKVQKGFSFRPVLIHVNGVTDAVVESGFFAKIIDFGDFFTD